MICVYGWGEKKEIQWTEGMSIADLIKTLTGGNDFSFSVARINQKYVARPNFKNTIISDGDCVYFIPMIAGG